LYNSAFEFGKSTL